MEMIDAMAARNTPNSQLYFPSVAMICGRRPAALSSSREKAGLAAGGAVPADSCMAARRTSAVAGTPSRTAREACDIEPEQAVAHAKPTTTGTRR